MYLVIDVSQVVIMKWLSFAVFEWAQTGCQNQTLQNGCQQPGEKNLEMGLEHCSKSMQPNDLEKGEGNCEPYMLRTFP